MKKPLISIIVPVFNVEKYLEQCLNSIVAQTYPNIEIIVIDDGSTDSSGRICDEFKSKYDNIIVIHQENKGLAASRNKGLDIASGEYIGFIDSDDWIEPDMYDKLYALTIRYDADISSCLSNNMGDVEMGECDYKNGTINIFKSFDIIKELYTQSEIRFEVWNKLWKRDFIADTRFMPGQICEDVRFDRILFMKANMIVHINDVCHHYRVDRPGNTLSSFKVKKLCIFKEFEHWINEVLYKNSQESVMILKIIYLRFAYAFYIEAIKRKQEKNILDELYRLFCNYYRDVIDEDCISIKEKMKYRLFFLAPQFTAYLINLIHRNAV